jgi:hypothetical protein
VTPPAPVNPPTVTPPTVTPPAPVNPPTVTPPANPQTVTSTTSLKPSISNTSVSSQALPTNVSITPNSALPVLDSATGFWSLTSPIGYQSETTISLLKDIGFLLIKDKINK